MPRKTTRSSTIEDLEKASGERGYVSIADLDAALDLEKGFEARVEALIAALGFLKIERRPVSECLALAGVDRERPRFGREDAGLRPYLRDLGHLVRMERDDEVRIARRLEFVLRRFQRFVVGSRFEQKQLHTLLPGSFCDSFVEDLRSEKSKSSTFSLSELSSEERLRALRDRCSELNAVRAEFVERNLQLVVNVAINYRTYGVPVMDLVQEGNAALIRAVEKFDWRKNVRFQTYATFWIRQAVERAIAFNKGIVRVPNYLQQKMRRLRREGVIPRGKSDVSVREMSEAFDVKPEVAGHLLETEKSHFSLDVSVDRDGETFASFLAADLGSTESTERLEFPLLKERLEEVLEELTPQERRILELRFGLQGDDPLTLEKVGKRMRVSRERIRQLQVRAIRKLQRPGLLEKLEGFV